MKHLFAILKILITKRKNTRDYLQDYASEYLILEPTTDFLPNFLHFFIWNHILLRPSDYFYSSDEYQPNFVGYILFNFLEGAYDGTPIGEHYSALAGFLSNANKEK